MSIESEETYRKPLPRPSAESQPFWDAAREHRLMLQKCKACGKFRFPPSQRCVHCLSGDHEWTEVSGTGKVFSFVTYHRLYHKGWDGELPYVVAVIELDEGPRLVSTVANCKADDVACDMKVKVVFDDVTPETTIPKFEPV